MNLEAQDEINTKYQKQKEGSNYTSKKDEIYEWGIDQSQQYYVLICFVHILMLIVKMDLLGHLIFPSIPGLGVIRFCDATMDFPSN